MGAFRAFRCDARPASCGARHGARPADRRAVLVSGCTSCALRIARLAARGACACVINAQRATSALAWPPR
eukprot:11202728-Lingulodinium_polyedra.AAC.1